MANKNDFKGWGILFGILGVVLFSTKAILVKLAYRYEVDTLELLLFRMLFSFPFYLIILFLTKNSFKLFQIAKKLSFCTHFSSFFSSVAQLCNSKKPSTGYRIPNFRLIPKSLNEFKEKGIVQPQKRDFLWVLLFGFLGYYLASYFDFLGLNYIKAGLERIILFVYPTIVVLLGFLFFKRSITKPQALAIGITYLGILIIFWNEVDISGSKTLWGGFLVLLSAIAYAAYLVGSGWLIPKYGVLRFTCYAMLVSTFCVVVHYALQGNWKLWNFPMPVYGYSIMMAIFSTLLPSFLVSASIKRLGASNFSILGSLGPVSTILLAYAFLGEELTYLQLSGMMVVIFGVTFLSLPGKRE
ncbi:DMT family transporter [Muricauda sp. SCSIO 64092]|uniref:DMT family transporter n=1 Tax=Allomuricauda sp. SCSIO 64092 TaxID=2908842 RepID=UPI001FF56D19|nr:DMT family transporter [Muricauda sp. SCSIO 64092]UOY06368.1 DMT family transporter [Muricauda sp. SCSIO 64092]